MIFLCGLGTMLVGLALFYFDCRQSSWHLDAEATFCAFLLIIIGAAAMGYSLLTFAIIHLP